MKRYYMTYLWILANWFVYCLIKLSSEDYCRARLALKTNNTGDHPEALSLSVSTK